jgi:hypothetical protein
MTIAIGNCHIKVKIIEGNSDTNRKRMRGYIDNSLESWIKIQLPMQWQLKTCEVMRLPDTVQCKFEPFKNRNTGSK